MSEPQALYFKLSLGLNQSGEPLDSKQVIQAPGHCCNLGVQWEGMESWDKTNCLVWRETLSTFSDRLDMGKKTENVERGSH